MLSELWKSKIERYLCRANAKFIKERSHKLVVYANDFIGVKIFTDGIFERIQLETLQGFLNRLLGAEQKDLIALDIGANIGNHSLFFSKYFSEVHSFEPHPFTYQILKLNTQFEENITPFNFGLGDKNETIDLYEDSSNFGASSTIHRNDEKAKKIAINVKRLDEINFGEKKIGLIKIDVEGMESAVINGGIQLIQKQMPIILLEQMESEFLNLTSETESIRELRKLGYQFCWFEKEESDKWWISSLSKLIGLFRSRQVYYNISTDLIVPKSTYDMLIALPPKLSAILN